MSDSDRGGNDKARLKLWLCRAVGAALALIAIVSIQHWIHYDNAATRAANDASQSKEQIAAECIAPSTFAKCAREIEQASRTEQRGEYDLYSQQAMALWTSVMGSMAIFGIALSAVGVYLIWRTWDATREAADNSRRTLRSFIAKERAHLRIREADYSFEGDEGQIGVNNQGFRLVLENKGESACTVLEIGWQYSPVRHWLPKREQTTFKPVLIPAQSKEFSPHLGISELPSSPCWLMGRAKYQTLENETFTSYFSLKIELHIDSGYRPSEWRAVEDRMTAMPHDT